MTMQQPLVPVLATPAPVQASAPTADAASSRLASIDIVRGLAIFSIIGADQLAWAVRGVAGDEPSAFASLSRSVAAQFEHAEWEGFRFYDLILPLLIFVTGASVVFSLSNEREHKDLLQSYWRVMRRAALLYALGIAYYGGLSAAWPDIRLLGVLQRIAICYLVASLLFLHVPVRALVAVVVALLLGYWAAFELISVDEVQAGIYLPEANLAHWVDRQFLPGRLWYQTWDPEGMLSTVPAIATCLLGVLAALVLRREDIAPAHKAGLLVFCGAAALALGHVWGLRFPVIKTLWTSSYVLVAGGYSLLLLGLAHCVGEIWRVGGALKVFVWIGANAIALYLLEGVIGFSKLAERLLGSEITMRLDAMRPGAAATANAVLGLTLVICLARFLYARRLFLRV